MTITRPRNVINVISDLRLTYTCHKLHSIFIKNTNAT